MAFALAPEAVAAGYRLAAYDTIGSTSTEAMSRLRAGERGPLWIVSAHQSEGRGRRGSAWGTPRGNLAASLALCLDAEPTKIATLGFVAGVTLVRALESCDTHSPSDHGTLNAAPSPVWERDGVRVADSPENSRPSPHPSPNGRGGPRQASRASKPIFALKWPNDVLADGAKLAGILLETEDTRRGRAVVVGIGVNVAHAPEGLPYPATSSRAMGAGVSAERLFAALSAEWARAFAAWDRGRGFAEIRQAWLSRAAALGGPVAIRSGDAEWRGTFETLDEGGQLILRLADGASRAVSAGEVHFGAAATARPGEAA